MVPENAPPHPLSLSLSLPLSLCDGNVAAAHLQSPPLWILQVSPLPSTTDQKRVKQLFIQHLADICIYLYFNLLRFCAI